jgi:energy-coupling factor transporter ATP-binding protein EcfA2
MGSSLSRQEELFLQRQWAELLETAMEADLETQANSASRNDAEGDSSADPRRTFTSKSTKAKKKDEFHMSFQEWQAFLSVLEQKEASSAPSDIAARMTASQLHVPAVALVVHVCVWWRGAIATSALIDRVEQLVGLVNEIQERNVTMPSPPLQEEEEKELSGDDTHHGENLEQKPKDAAPAVSRRARLARFVQKKVIDRARRRPASTAPADDVQDALLLDTFADLACLVQELLNKSASAGLTVSDSHDNPHTSAVSTSGHAREVYELYDKKISDSDALRQRPVLAVVMVLVLAVFASKVESEPQLAVRSVLHLASLDSLIFSSDKSSSTTSKSSKPAPATSSAELVELWPLVGELEVSLVHREHEADVVRCLSKEGTELMNTLRQMRKKREALQRVTVATKALTASVPAPALSASDRWTAGASQYIGQRHIWQQLRSHFLSADVFDADKPTVLVFFGPSGYGKSELAKRVASVLHDCPVSELESSGKMVYIHMPSFCTKDSIYSLVDPPAAHVGSGILLSALQKHPDAVVVLDEFEKSTAESINNLWLSAFQKNGVLRSLKEASRSVSTVRTTFILTCNISADSIAKREDLYLGASPAHQETIRNLFVTQCKDVCRETMGDPFVNRVDFFFPFMPYTRAERRQFVCLLLERLLSSQVKKDRQLYVTPSFVETMVDKLHTFHAATLEEVVRSQVMGMVQAGWASAVLTVERRISGAVIVLLPTTTITSTSTPTTTNSSISNDEGSGGGTRSLLVEAWDALPGGAETLQKWNSESAAPLETAATPLSPLPPVTPPPSKAAEAEVVRLNATTHQRPVVHGSVAPPPPPQRAEKQPPDSPLLEKQYEREYTMEKARIVELEKELEKARDLVKLRDLEIVTLKEKVLLLQKALAVVVLALMSCLCLLAVLIGLKLTLLFALTMVGVVVLMLGVPLRLLLEAVQALFRVLGPFKGGVLVLLVVMWIAKASRSFASCP